MVGSAPHKSGRRSVKFWPVDTHKPYSLQAFGFVTFVTNKINKPQSDVATHWIHLKLSQIKQRQYKPDWRCTIYTHTHTTRNNNANHIQHNSPSPTKHHTPTHKQQSTNVHIIVILQININGIRNKIEELKTSYTAPDIITIQETKLTQKAKTPKTPHYTTIHTDREYKQ